MSEAIAILGASTDRRKYGNIAVRAYRDLGWTVYPVNPRAASIEGITALASMAEVPEGVDRVSVYLPPAVLLGELDAVAARRPGEVWLNPGSESEEVLSRLEALGLNVVQACSIVDRGVSPGDIPGLTAPAAVIFANCKYPAAVCESPLEACFVPVLARCGCGRGRVELGRR